VKKKTKPKVKVARTTRLPKPRVREVEGVTERALRLAIEKALPDFLKASRQPMPAQTSHSVAIVKNCVKFYETTTGAKANQTRLIDFVRWCEENSGLL